MSEITRRDLLCTGLALSAGSLMVNRSEGQERSTPAGESGGPPAPAISADPATEAGPRERLLQELLRLAPELTRI